MEKETSRCGTNEGQDYCTTNYVSFCREKCDDRICSIIIKGISDPEVDDTYYSLGSVGDKCACKPPVTEIDYPQEPNLAVQPPLPYFYDCEKVMDIEPKHLEFYIRGNWVCQSHILDDSSLEIPEPITEPITDLSSGSSFCREGDICRPGCEDGICRVINQDLSVTPQDYELGVNGDQCTCKSPISTRSLPPQHLFYDCEKMTGDKPSRPDTYIRGDWVCTRYFSSNSEEKTSPEVTESSPKKSSPKKSSPKKNFEKIEKILRLCTQRVCDRIVRDAYGVAGYDAETIYCGWRLVSVRSGRCLPAYATDPDLGSGDSGRCLEHIPAA